MSNMHGNDAFVTGKQGSALDTAFEVMADSQRDRYFSTVGFGIVSTMHHPAALMPQKLAEMKDPRPIIVMERAERPSVSPFRAGHAPHTELQSGGIYLMMGM